MNNIETIMKVRNVDYLEWQTKIHKLEKENESLKSQLSDIKTLDRDEVEKILDEHTYICEVQEDCNTKELVLTNNQIDDTITAICNLALPEIKTLGREEVLILYDEFIEKVFNNFKEEILEGYQSFKINQEYQIISDNFINAICKQ